MNNETRKEVIKKLEQYRQEELLFHNKERAKYFESVIEGLKGEEQNIGHWIEREIEDTMRWKECSECHSEYPNMNGLKYCPNCGAKMEELKGE